MVAVLSTEITKVGQSSDSQVESGVKKAIFLDNDSKIAINATQARDATRIARLLNFSGVGRCSILHCDATQISSVQAYAVIVCHRQADDKSTISLPDAKNVSRIIVLSDCTHEDTAVSLLKEGARHFLNMREPDRVLQARLEAALRQHRSEALRSFVEGDIHFDVQKRRATRAGHVIDLSPKEFEFACRLFSRLDQVVKNSELMTSVWSLPPHMDTRRIDTAACRVRKKLGLSLEEGWELKKVRRVGYRLTRVEEASA